MAGCIVLYNPTDDVIENIASYINALAVLYVVDNSEAVDEDLVHRLQLLSPKIIYLPQNGNAGIATALNVGAGTAVAAGFAWLLTMDQDSRFNSDAFFDLWQAEALPLHDVGLIAASYTDSYDRWQKLYNGYFNEIHFAITSGNIINLKAWQQVNGFEDKLFIDEVDHDYCLKLRSHHYKVLITQQIFFSHAIGHIHKKGAGILQAERDIKLHIPLRYYYMARNVLYMCKKYIFTDFRFVALRFFYLIKGLIKIIMHYPDKGPYFKYFFAGVKDFMRSNYGQYKR